MPASFPGFVRAVYGIFRLETGPEDLPRSWLLLAGSLAAYAVSEFALNLFTHTVAGAGLGAALAVGMLIVLTAAVLAIYWVGGRIPQTLTALALVGTIVSLAGIGARLVLLWGLPAEAPFQRIAAFVLLPIVFWRWVLFAFVYWRAAPLPTLAAYALAIGYIGILGAVVSYFIPRTL